MAQLPSNLKNIADFFQRLPGIGAKTANRLAFYLLRMPEGDLKAFAHSIEQLKSKTKRCVVCMNLTENETCEICQSAQRDKTTITVVEDVIDLLSFETGNIYNGLYHVLHGKIDPLNSVGPDDIFIESLFQRIKKDNEIQEIILATNLDMEGEATAMYIKGKIEEMFTNSKRSIKVSRLAYGLPMGANLEYADYMTLKRAIEGRNTF